MRDRTLELLDIDGGLRISIVRRETQIDTFTLSGRGGLIDHGLEHTAQAAGLRLDAQQSALQVTQVDQVITESEDAHRISPNSLKVFDLVGLEIADVPAQHAVERREHQGQRTSETFDDAGVEARLESVDVLQFVEGFTLCADPLDLGFLLSLHRRCESLPFPG